jgi:phenylalanyl-tRNA synthetase alpha chain
MSAEERPKFAKEINDAAQAIERELDDATARVAESAVAKQIEAEWQDLTLSGIAQERGSTHPLTQVHKKAMDVMRRLGFTLEEGPDIETPYYNFDALNIPENHPARDMGYVGFEQHRCARTRRQSGAYAGETSAAADQGRRGGRVFLNEAVDATHLAMFHQFDIWVEGLTYGDLKGRDRDREVDLRRRPRLTSPKYYPYTGPRSAWT